MHDALNVRIKENYESRYKIKLCARVPVIIRVDGKSFSKYTASLDRPFDLKFIDAMNNVALDLCKQIQGAQIAYVQSDEVSILLHNYKKFDSQAWFDNQLQKMVSISASIASVRMTLLSRYLFPHVRPAYFDSRAFILPEAEVNNAFLGRQNDARRNSIQMLARSLYSQKSCNRKNGEELKEMILAKDQDWNNLPARLRMGRCAVKYKYNVDGTERARWKIDNEIPRFSENPNYIEQYLERDQV